MSRDPLTAKRRWLVVAGVATWIAAIAGGMAILWGYQRAAGEAADAPAHWPADSAIARSPGRPVVVLFVHPQCPCSRASVSELATLLDHLPHPPPVHILFMRPPGAPEGWAHTDLWRQAERIPGATVLVDGDGREAARFGARTSGQTLVYGERGELRFAGGITGTRGEVGDNAGRQRVLAVLREAAPDRRESLVFGCPLDESSTGGAR